MADEVKKKGLQNVQIDLTKVKDKTLGEVFGTGPMAITEINKKVWALIREENLRVPK